MLSESEGDCNQKDLITIMKKSYFDWSTLYGKKPDNDISYEYNIDFDEILKDENKMEKILKRNFSNIVKLRDFQKKAIDSLILEKKNIFVQNYTGSGKSLLFQLYALFHPGLTVVISPFVAITLGNPFLNYNPKTKSKNHL
jgi:ATP-dependent helicase YprA (DUF1998 family)